MIRPLLLSSFLATAGVLALPVLAATNAPARALTTTIADDPEPEPKPEAKDQVTYWVLQASGKG